MTYRELIKLYKAGELEAEQKERVKKDIERQEAISEYLFEQEEIPGLDDLKNDTIGNQTTGSLSSEEMDDESAGFVKMIRSSIRKAFLKMGIAVGFIVILVVLFVMFALPEVVDLFYYNPAEIAGEDAEGYTTNRLSLDMATYSELFLPGRFRDTVVVDENGYGEYDINIIQSSSITGVFTNVAGKIEKGKMVLYDSNLLKIPTGNAFVRDFVNVEDYHLDNNRGAAGDYEEAMNELQELDEDEYYMAYVTLDEVMNYSEFVEWTKNGEVYPWWCAICQENEDGYFVNENIGFIYSSSAGDLHYDEETYPYLSYFDAGTTTGEEQDWIVSEEIMTKHVVSMLRYMNGQEDFCNMVGYINEENYLDKFADNVEDNGLNIYGFVVVAQKGEILDISSLDKVAYIYTQPMR